MAVKCERLVLSIVCVVLAGMLSVGVVTAQDVPAATPEATPDPVALVDEGENDIINFLLLGSDTFSPTNAGRTDVIMIVSVNRTAGTVALMSIPRDFYVYVPGHEYTKINIAYSQGERGDHEDGGPQLLADTVQHNLGIEIDYYARVNFEVFKTIVDNLGGVEISVDCAIQDWRLKAPDLDLSVEENWEMFTLPVGVHNMDGDLALWYVRSRRTSSDFDRGRRQQAMMLAIWHRIQALGLLNQMTDLWPQVSEMIDTNIPQSIILDLVPLAINIQSSHIKTYTFRPGQEVMFGTSPEGWSILRPVPDAISTMTQRFYTPPTQSQLVQEAPTIEIVNASGVRSFPQIAADRLALEGFVPVISEETAPYREYTMIYDYTGRSKGSSLGMLQAILRVNEQGVVAEPDPGREYDFQVVLGGSYFTCTHNVLPPEEIATEEPSPETVAVNPE